MLSYRNLPGWERALRLALGAGLLTGGALLWGRPGAIVLLIGGCAAVVTALVAWCPLCAAVGRRRVE